MPLDLVLKQKQSARGLRFELVVENGADKDYAILSGQVDNEDPPSSELISVEGGKESADVARDPAPDLILLPDLQRSYGITGDQMRISTLWYRNCPG